MLYPVRKNGRFFGYADSDQIAKFGFERMPASMDSWGRAAGVGDNVRCFVFGVTRAPTVPMVFNTYTEDFEISLVDIGCIVDVDSANAVSVTLPYMDTFVVGHSLAVHRKGAGEVTMVAGSGCTVHSPNGTMLGARYSTIMCVYRGNGEWFLTGNVKES